MDDGGLAPPSSQDTFNDAAVTRAEGPLVGRYLRDRSGARSTLDVGVLMGCDDPPRATARADGFDRHTFLCGQSGSGKTFALGLLIERLLIETDLRLVIIDPNSDFVRLGDEPSQGTGSRAEADMVARYQQATRNVRIMRPLPLQARAKP
jgi:DNA helicase HerA-like ATPase